jgi:hypothetical protein
MKKNVVRILVFCAAVALAMSVFWGLRTAPKPVSADTPGLELFVLEPAQFDNALIQVYVRAVNPGALSAFEFSIQLDPALAEVTAIRPLSALGQSGTCSPAALTCAAALGPRPAADGTRLGIYTYGVAHPVTSDGTIAIITLQPKGKVGDLTLHLSTPLISNATGQVTVPLTNDLTFQLTDETHIYLPLLARKLP